MILCVGAFYFLDDLDIKWKLAGVAAMVAAVYAHFETKIEDIKMDISILYDRMNKVDKEINDHIDDHIFDLEGNQEMWKTKD